MNRFECMEILASKLKDELVILSLGGAVDEWFNAAPHIREATLFQQQLGCVTPQAFGLAVGLPHRKVIALDTDGGVLFNLGILATLANERPANLTVIVWDNECYQSIGCPPTHTAGVVDLAGIARGAGIAEAHTAKNQGDFDELTTRALKANELYLIVAKIEPTIEQNLHRKHSDGVEDMITFVRHVEKTEGISIMGPSEHN